LVWIAGEPGIGKTTLIETRGEHNFNVGPRAKITVHLPTDRYLDLLTLAWRTAQSISMLVRTIWPLGTGKDRYEVTGIGVPEEFGNVVSQWADDLRAGRPRRTTKRNPNACSSHLSWEFEEPDAGQICRSADSRLIEPLRVPTQGPCHRADAGVRRSHTRAP
jgi:hypothetical protein